MARRTDRAAHRTNGNSKKRSRLNLRFPDELDQLASLVELSRWRAVHQPERSAYYFLKDGIAIDASLTYAALDQHARAIAGFLQSRAGFGDRILLLYPPGLHFVRVFLGCLYAGVLAVPAPPLDPLRMKQSLSRLQGIASDARITGVLTTPEIVQSAERAGLSLSGEDPTRWFTVDDVREDWARQWRPPDLTPNHVAYLQYTSGSTTTPKGVMVTHRNLLHHCGYVTKFAGYDAQAVTLSWMPHFHDYGLVKGILHPLFAGIPSYLMSALAFLKQPIRWLEAIERYGITHSGGPNFAYAHCVRRTTPAERANLNLSSWRVASCGAEPISKDTMDQFIEAFRASGFRREAFHPAYGMAEFTLLISVKRAHDAPSFRSLDAQALEKGLVREIGEDQPDARQVVSCGPSVGETKVVIVDPERLQPCDPDVVGEIWLADPSIAKGYWNKPEETNETFGAHLAATGEGPFLRTGDLGFVKNGELFVTGRLKDLVIIRGRNHYPQDIERTAAQSHPSLRQGSGAAFSIETGGEERLVIVQELERREHGTSIEDVAGAIRESVAAHHDIQVYAVALVRAGSIPKTSSGKIQRRACRDAFLSTRLGIVGISTLGNDEPKPRDHDLTRDDLLALTLDEQREILLTSLEALVSRLLGIPPSRLSREQPLTTAGLDSLTATELAHAVETRFGVSLSLPALLDGASIQQLTTHVLDQLSASSASFPVRREMLQETNGPVEYPLSRNQSALWFLHQLSPHTKAANATLLLRVSGPLDQRILVRALEKLAVRHPCLRTTYVARHGVPFQQIHPTVPLHFVETDASGWNWNDVKTYTERAAGLSFDLERGPLWRAQLFRRSPTEAYLLLAAHHIAVDGWSMKVLIEDLKRLYEGERSGEKHPLPEPAAPYADFVHWQNDLLAGPQGQRLWSYWQETLSGELPVLDLAHGRPRPSMQRDNTAWREFALSAKLTRRLKALAEAEGTTVYVTLLAALQVFLYRYTGQEDILIGSPMVGRSRGMFSETVGDFVNVVVLRDHVSGAATFKALLSQARRTVLEAIAHQDYPFSLLVERLQPARDPSRAPLVQVLLVLQKFKLMTQLNGDNRPHKSGTAGSSKQLHFEPYVIPQSAGQFDLTIEISDSDGPLTGCFEYNADLFDAATVGRMQEHFQVLLEGIVDQPNQLLADLPLMTPEEHHQVLVAWNETRSSRAETRCLHALFDEQVVRTPDAMAVMFEDQRLSYRELHLRANQLGHYLSRLGVGPDVLVGLCVERSLELIVGLMGILKAGGAYLPLDPEYPTKRMASMLEEARVSILLTQQHLLARLPDHQQSRAVCLDTEWSAIARESGESPVNGTKAGDLAYVIYTSGSTGRPKGVMVEHRSVVNYVAAISAQARLGPGDRILQLASVSVDTAAEEIFTCLLTGAALVLRTGSMLDSIPGFLQKCREWRITLLDLPTAYWHELTAGLRRESLDFPPNISSVVIGGERALPQSLMTWQQHVGSRVRLLNTYGPTEVTIAATVCDLTSAEPSSGPPIGRAIQNVQVYVLDRNLQPLPIEIPGELYVGGVGLARGYLKRVDLTAERFIRNPFDLEPGARLYRTGDLARWLPNGELEYLGRVDRQVKIRGYRIELEEIESVLQTHPEIRAVTVEVREDLPGDKRLVAFVVTASGSALNVNHLRAFLKEQLPDPMIPSAFVELDALPLTPNGKIDRKALQAPVNSRAGLLHLKTEYVAPRNSTEQLVADVWGEILDIKDVGVHDNFFELGGHSLLATQMFSRLRSLFHVDPPLRAVFETPTIAGLAQRLAEQQPREASTLAVPLITPVPRDGLLPLSFAQERMWFLYQLAPASSAYNIPVTVRLVGPLDKEALAHSLNELVRRHESLRTTFHHAESHPVQMVHPFQALTITEVDLRKRPKARRGDEAIELATDEARRPFDLTTGPLIRVLVIQVSDEEHVVVLTTHHIVSDHWSYGVIGRELVQCYNAFCDGHPLRIEPPLEIQYVDFACWQRHWLRGPVLDGQLAYWKAQLAGVPVLALPTDRPRRAAQSFRGAHVSLDLPRSLINGLKHLSVQEGVTLYMVFLAGFVALLNRLTGQEDIAVGTPIANRNHLVIEGLVGTFVNTLVLRTDVSREPTFRELLGRVRDVALGAYAQQDLPFEKLVEELRPDRSHGGSPLVQVLFNFANTPFGRVDFKNLSWAPCEIDRGASQLDISVSIDPTVSRRVYLEFDTDLFDRSSMERWLTHYRTLLEAVVEEPGTAVARLRLLSESERRRILVEWNATSADELTDRCLPQLVEEQVTRTPEAIAAESQGSQLTYAELNLRANQIAHWLRSRGVGPDVVVAVLMERSLDVLICLLGILKAGGAYLPLDTGLPTRRVSFMLENSGAALLLTTRALAKTISDRHARVIDFDSEQKSFARQSKDNPFPRAGSRSLAYVIYTSGSTGQPKGVEIEHRALVNCLQSMRRKPGLTEHDVLLSVTTLAFDIAGLELFLPLLVGGTTSLATRDEAADGAWLKEQLEAGRITVMQATPATWRLLLEAGWAGNPRLKILCGGEALPRDLSEELHARAESVWNMYGPTETTIWSTVHKVESGESPVSIGRPIGNTQVYILDSRLEPVPIGIPGELYIGGLGLARGYRGAPDVTAAKFIASPFLRGSSERLYRTGDQARWLPDGRIDCLGRMDHQVKVRGFRIELGEIEMALSECAEVKQCVVVVRQDTPGENRVVAYVVPHEGHVLQPGRIRRQLREQLPEYMVPAAVVQLSALPVTPNGKVDRLALPSPGDEAPAGLIGSVTPRNRLELQLTAIWEQVLGVAPIGVRDNFFDLGGHSLLALQIFGAIEQTLGKRLPMSLLLQAPTIELLADVLNQEGCTIRWDSLVAIQPRGTRPPIFLVPGVGGNVLVFAHLAKQLGQEQPVFGLQARGLDGEARPFTRVEEMAAHYVQEIRSVRPNGPYLIGGTCTGGAVAYEMAQQLMGHGEPVTLAIVESWHPRSHQAYRNAPPFFLRPAIYLLRKTIRSCRESWQLPFREWPSHWRGKILSITNRLEGRRFPLGNEEYYTDLVTSTTFHAVARYQPRPYPGRLLNVIAATRLLSSSTQDTRLTWNELALKGGQTVFISAEDSGRLFVPGHVQELAHHLAAYFDQDSPAHVKQSDLATLENADRIDPARP
jgi:amino acid adenylation domain-containing protein